MKVAPPARKPMQMMGKDSPMEEMMEPSDNPQEEAAEQSDSSGDGSDGNPDDSLAYMDDMLTDLSLDELQQLKSKVQLAIDKAAPPETKMLDLKHFTDREGAGS